MTLGLLACGAAADGAGESRCDRRMCVASPTGHGGPTSTLELPDGSLLNIANGCSGDVTRWVLD